MNSDQQNHTKEECLQGRRHLTGPDKFHVCNLTSFSLNVCCKMFGSHCLLLIKACIVWVHWRYKMHLMAVVPISCWSSNKNSPASAFFRLIIIFVLSWHHNSAIPSAFPAHRARDPECQQKEERSSTSSLHGGHRNRRLTQLKLNSTYQIQRLS